MKTDKLKALMVEKGFTQRSLAKELGIGLNTVNEILNNKTSPRLNLIQDLCEILDIQDNKTKIDIFFG